MQPMLPKQGLRQIGVPSQELGNEITADQISCRTLCLARGFKEKVSAGKDISLIRLVIDFS
jgi:hypothetical protein